jgi:hypothetical protein
MVSLLYHYAVPVFSPSDDAMSPYEKLKDQMTATEYLLRKTESRSSSGSESDDSSDDAASSGDNDYVPNDPVPNDPCWCGDLCHDPGYARPDFAKKDVPERSHTSRSMLWGQPPYETTLSRRKSRGQIARPTGQESDPPSPPPSRSTVQQRSPSRQTTASASRTQNTPTRSPPVTALSLQARHLGKADMSGSEYYSVRQAVQATLLSEQGSSGLKEPQEGPSYYEHESHAW